MAGRGFYVNFKVPELKQALTDIQKYDTKTAMRIEAAVSSSTKAIGKGARSRVPVKTGDLKKSIRTSFNTQKVEGTISAKQHYAHIVEFGGKATTIKSKKPMKFIGDAEMFAGTGGQFGITFARQVSIPKRRERPYMRPAFEAEKGNLIKNITEAVKPK